MANEVKKLRIGFIGVIQPSFWGSTESMFENYYIPEMKRIAVEMDFDLYTVNKIVATVADAQIAAKELLDEKVDFLLIQMSTFADGHIMEVLADTHLRMGLWALPEITATGPIPLNSFCGMNMYASIAGQYIDRNITFKWFYGDISERMFIERFRITVAALTALKNIDGSKFGLVGGIAPGFNNLYYDERKTKARLNIKVYRDIEFSDVKSKALEYKDSDIWKTAEEMAAEASCVTQNTKEQLMVGARVYRAFEDIIKENGYSGIAVGCWPKYRKELGIVPCAIIGRLLSKGHIVACEGDIDSAISMIILKLITKKNPMLMDLSKLDFNDDTFLMWHCGSAPVDFADGNGICLTEHYKPGSRAAGGDSVKVGMVNDVHFRAQPITVARLTCDYEKMFCFTGEFIDKKDKAFDGSRGWVANPCMHGKHLKLQDLVNTIIMHRFQHHYPIVAGNVEDILLEFMAWTGIKPLKPVEYKDYLQNQDVDF